MPLIQEAHDYLQYVDSEPDQSKRDAAVALLAAEASSLNGSSQPLHPSVAVEYTPIFPSLVSTSHDSIASTTKPRDPTTGIDLTRYEEPDAPASASASASEQAEQWQKTLRAAYTSHQYLSQRAMNLSLLERYGKNAWLIGNSQVEDELRGLERELKAAKEQGTADEEERRFKQAGIKAEIEALEESWRNSLGRAVEAEIAGLSLRQQALQRRKQGAA